MPMMTRPGPDGTQLCLSRPFIRALDLHTLDCASDFGWRTASGFDQNNQHCQDSNRPGNRGEEHQADCY